RGGAGHGARGGGGGAVLLDGRPLETPPPGESLSLDTTELEDGHHTLLIEAWDRAWSPNLQASKYTLIVDNSPPDVQLARRSLTTAQGRAHALIVRTTEPVSAPSGAFREAPVTFFPLDDSGTLWRALAGVPIQARTGRKALELRVEDQAGNVSERTIPVAVVAGRFTRGGTIRLTEQQIAARRNESAKKKMRAQREAAYTWDQPEQLWAGPMQRPIDGGRISSGFGRYRTYSDGKKSHHTGTDIAARTGTPVVAAGAGEVRFVGEQSIFGNVVIVHHGQGLSTSYNHLSEIHVDAGQRVARGEQIGAVGSTGQATGPHLHWGVVLDGTAVDGMPLLDDSLGLGETPHWTHATADGQLIPLRPDGADPHPR
ncbi:MAG: M23 family metallopeptidase, partial [Myxococcota bacterium]|nr:M23 family metallopeptidase [Myxococcota bacterium]